ncbi:ComF family protein [Nocardia pseudobrasiliensis]|uniref:Putative amidophosphoribosyltransferase n=1 Tax=Nocardia pseudobrasiliensis TaxID=45979 RepID=A0A370IDR4_9NOCA|nr:ComF family protein [Nocardia pseudobrasiliensis]RDI68720.1 putative amidophosphoribosyltransferase [Nocardia pseudobrasiliensis]
MLLDLILPQSCGGCGELGAGWCAGCAESLAGPPIRVYPRADPGVPCWALGRYRGPVRRAVVAVKEQGRRDLAVPLGRALARGLDGLRDRQRSLVLVPAPSRGAAARRRGGDPVARTVRVAGSWLPDCRIAPILRMRRGVRDSVGLGASARAHNLRGRVVVSAGSLPTAVAHPNVEVVLVDDVLTTGATARESVRTLARAGIAVRAVLVTSTV